MADCRWLRIHSVSVERRMWWCMLYNKGVTLEVCKLCCFFDSQKEVVNEADNESSI